MSIAIRDEQESDIAAIRSLTLQAFADVPQSRQTEAAVIDALRAAGALTLSLVAVEGGDIVGHVAVSPLSIDGDAGPGWYGGGPLSVRPDRQRAGIGTALIRAVFERLRENGARGAVVVGDPRYYERFGFRQATTLALPDVPAENLLVLALDGQCPTGTVAFHPAFGVEDTTPPA
ncbi:GNAT family N-acetyltransferase [Mycolicibacterium austroafricanum]|uniref:GNAT family N-acetyltransferase n=1 Tax=Mycolicibacterium austroafricanum TaxID=39687 RepID=UPI001CA38145|nr:N-acetyltransferase [Mycolicibacterium austroafricanum]QZT54660.1 N-acetyltransferase [Mycolicibacterium austroafricanum]